MMKYTVSKDQPPPYIPGVQYWERSVDPSNPGLLVAAMQAEGLMPLEKFDKSLAATGWAAIEWTENVVGFFPDGHEFETDEAPEYHFTDVGPSGHLIAERALNSLQNARWYQSHGNILVRVGYNSRTVIEKTALIDCLAIIMHTEDVERFAAEFATVQYKRHELSPAPNINSKPLFIVSEKPEPPNRPALEGAGEFIVVMRRHGLKPKGTISEFD